MIQHLYKEGLLMALGREPSTGYTEEYGNSSLEDCRVS